MNRAFHSLTILQVGLQRISKRGTRHNTTIIVLNNSPRNCWSKRDHDSLSKYNIIE